MNLPNPLNLFSIGIGHAKKFIFLKTMSQLQADAAMHTAEQQKALLTQAEADERQGLHVSAATLRRAANHVGGGTQWLDELDADIERLAHPCPLVRLATAVQPRLPPPAEPQELRLQAMVPSPSAVVEPALHPMPDAGKRGPGRPRKPVLAEAPPPQ